MAVIEIALTNVTHLSVRGVVTPVARGRAKHLALNTEAASGVLQDDGQDYAAPEGGAIAVIQPPVAIWLRVFRQGDSTAAGSGAGWRIPADALHPISLEHGDRIRAAVVS